MDEWVGGRAYVCCMFVGLLVCVFVCLFVSVYVRVCVYVCIYITSMMYTLLPKNAWYVMATSLRIRYLDQWNTCGIIHAPMQHCLNEETTHAHVFAPRVSFRVHDDLIAAFA